MAQMDFSLINYIKECFLSVAWSLYTILITYSLEQKFEEEILPTTIPLSTIQQNQVVVQQPPSYDTIEKINKG